MHLNNVVYLKKKQLEFSAFFRQQKNSNNKIVITDTKENIILLPIFRVHCQVPQ